MSDEVFEIMTTFSDVAELGQGYVNRADGERILLPLPIGVEIGEGVRFIIHLADGTPAFAGAGRAVQVSDQGGTVGPAERYETLLDNLAFDDRSRPVYEYIVAVRQALYAAGGAEAQAEQEAAASAEAVEAGMGDEDATAFVETVALDEASQAAEAELLATPAPEPEPEDAIDAAHVDGVVINSDVPPSTPSDAPAEEVLVPSVVPIEMAEPISAAPAAPPVEPSIPAPHYDPVVHEPLPTGMLKRPALGAHWQPGAPKPPQSSRGTGLFRYPAGGLPVPARPARPQLDPSQWVQPAPSPRA